MSDFDDFIQTRIVNLDGSTDVPQWLRSTIDRLGIGLELGGLGGRAKRAASDEVIENLQPVPLSDLESMDCPICYDAYEKAKSELNEERDIKFNDPSLFFPHNEVATTYTKFPVKNLVTGKEPTDEEILPGYTELVEPGANVEIPHVPVKMPGCNHIFGKSCVIEWLKGHVTCPLCRKEVESGLGNNKASKRARVREISNFYFNDENETVNHITDRSTDVFNPYRRPFNLRITPLTDGNIDQSWGQTNEERHSGTVDPPLTLPRAFPMPEMTDEFSSNAFTPEARTTWRSRMTTQNNGQTNSSVTTNAGSDARPPALFGRSFQSLLRGRGGTERRPSSSSNGRPDEP